MFNVNGRKRSPTERAMIAILPPLILILLAPITSVPGLAQQDVEAVEDDLVRVYIASYPTGQPVIIDGVVYFPIGKQPIMLEWEPGSIHTIEILVDTWYVEPGVRFVFKSWNLGSDEYRITVEAREGLSIIAIYERQYFVEVTSPYGNPQGTGWYPAGSLVEISVEPVVEIGDASRAVFLQWSEGDNVSQPRTFLYVFEPKKVTALWKVEHYVEVISSIEGAPVSGSGWYQENSVATLTAAVEVKESSEVVWRFSTWRLVEGSLAVDSIDTPVLSFKVTGPLVLEAIYDKYYYVEAITPIGEAEGSGYYREGDTAVISVPDIVDQGSGVRYVFAGWTGDYESSQPRIAVVVDKPITVVANWRIQFYVDVESSEPAVQGVRGDGWYYEGGQARIIAPAVVPGNFGVRYVFAGWTGDYNGDSPEATITVNSPKKIQAVYLKDYTGFYVNIATVIFAAMALYLGYAFAVPAAIRFVRKAQKDKLINDKK